jgi:hypothetical protein
MVRELTIAERRMEGTTVKTFPIVTDDDTRMLVGYIGRTELHYVIGEFGSYTLLDAS